MNSILMELSIRFIPNQRLRFCSSSQTYPNSSQDTKRKLLTCPTAKQISGRISNLQLEGLVMYILHWTETALLLEDVLAFFNLTTSGQYTSRFRQAFDLDLSPFDIEKRARELVALDLGAYDNEDTKARLYFKTNQNTRKGNLLVYIDPDTKLSGILVRLAAYVSHRPVEDIRTLLADFDTDGELFQNLSVSLRDVSEDEERLKQLDLRINELYKMGMKAKSIFSYTTLAKPPENDEFAGVITFTALSSAVWTEILREKLLSPIFQTFGDDLAVTLGNLHWYHEAKCSTLSNQLLASACELNSRFIMFFGQLTEHQAWIIPLVMLFISELCFRRGLYWMYIFEIISLAIFDWRVAVGFMLATAIVYAQYSSKKFPRSPLIVGHLLVLFQVYLALVMSTTLYLHFNQTSENSRKIYQAATLLEELNLLLLPECTRHHAAIMRPIVVPLHLFLISFPVLDWKVKTVFFSILIPSLVFEYCTMMHQAPWPKPKWSELWRSQYFYKVLSQGRVQRWLLIAVVAVLLDGFWPVYGFSNIIIAVVFAIAIWKSNGIQ
jgi:hypothetical protein